MRNFDLARTCPRRLRRAATMLESTIVLGVFLSILLFSLETSLVVIRHNALSACARRLVRVASLQGGKAASGGWGPATLSMKANSSHPAAQAIAPLLTTMRADEVQIELTWPDGERQPGDRVRASLSYNHQPVVSLIPRSLGWSLNASSQSLIAH